MVCLGNICRSPLAEGILKSKLNPEQYLVSSSGTSNYHIGCKPDIRSIQTAKAHGIDITDQRAAQFKSDDFQIYDFIYAMDNSNYENIIKLANTQEDKSKVKLILNETHPNKGFDVPDPYYGGDQGFEEVFQMLDEACNVIASTLEKKN